MVKANKPEQVEDPSIGTADLLTIYKNNSQIIIGVTCAVIIIIIGIVFWINTTESNNDKAWFAFSKFKQETMSATDIEDSKIQEVLNAVEGTSAEPWVLYYCASVHFKNRQFQNAAELNNRLQRDFKNHYICKNESLYPKFNSLTNAEIEWLKAQ